MPFYYKLYICTQCDVISLRNCKSCSIPIRQLLLWCGWAHLTCLYITRFECTFAFPLNEEVCPNFWLVLYILVESQKLHWQTTFSANCFFIAFCQIMNTYRIFYTNLLWHETTEENFMAWQTKCGLKFKSQLLHTLLCTLC